MPDSLFTDRGAYVPLLGFPSLCAKLAANTMMMLPDVAADPEWGEVRILMREVEALRRVEQAARMIDRSAHYVIPNGLRELRPALAKLDEVREDDRGR